MMLLCLRIYAQTASRVIAFAKYGADTTIPCTDSGGYNKYSFDRGGAINSGTNYFDCDFPFPILIQQDFETGYNGLTKFDSSWETSTTDTDVSTQFFDADNNITNATTYKYYNGIWEKYLSHNYTYDVNNNLLAETDTAWHYLNNSILNVNQYTYTYNSLNKITAQTTKYWQDTQLQVFDDAHYYYDNNNNLTLVTGESFNLGNGSLADSSARTIYYTNNFPDSAIAISFNAYLQGIGGDLIKYYFSPATDTMVANFFAWDNYYRVTNVYDDHHNKIATATVVLDPSVTSLITQKQEWSYNSYNQVTAQRQYYPDSFGNWVFAGLTRFYYETYNPGPPFEINNLEIYPSPAQNTLTIKLEWDKAQPFTFSIWNVIGQKIMEWNEPAATEYEKTINLPRLASGHYFIRVNSGNQRLVKRFVIIN